MLAIMIGMQVLSWLLLAAAVYSVCIVAAVVEGLQARV